MQCVAVYEPVSCPDGSIHSNSCEAQANGWINCPSQNYYL
jgi:hypothetical protein